MIKDQGALSVSKIINITISNNMQIHCDCYQYNISVLVNNSTIKNNTVLVYQQVVVTLAAVILLHIQIP